MSDNRSIGRKYDQGKTLSATVLAGFWRVAGRDELTEALLHSYYSALTEHGVECLIDVFDEWFDVDKTIVERVNGAVNSLTTLVEPEFYLRGAIEVGSYGARKYAKDNWLHVDDGINRYYEAVGRHVEDLICGHWYDDDKEGPNGETVEGSHLPNLSHIFWGILAAGELLSRKRDAELDFETEAVDRDAEERAAHAEVLVMTHLFVKPEPLPGLVLPLEVGKKYRLTTPWGNADDRGVHVASNPELDDGDRVLQIGGWWFDAETGRFHGGDDGACKHYYIEGPVSE